MKFAHADADLINTLAAQWADQIEAAGGLREDVEGPFLDHARRIAGESPPDRNYGIHVMCDEDGALHGLCHANFARLPGTRGVTLRVLWVLLAPIYDSSDKPLEDVLTAFVYEALRLALDRQGTSAVKICLNNAPDRSFARGLAAALTRERADMKVAVRGSWLHIEDLASGGTLQ